MLHAFCFVVNSCLNGCIAYTFGRVHFWSRTLVIVFAKIRLETTILRYRLRMSCYDRQSRKKKEIEVKNTMYN